MDVYIVCISSRIWRAFIMNDKKANDTHFHDRFWCVVMFVITLKNGYHSFSSRH
jgi:hypothetical protein